ncbi:hypothetical protein [Variovorax terrae]|uniref:Uncharacterized protein n=1 Tax=Variovorax terrae TaxID=2923278 RepID=A0A9X2ALY5_9BURK|nr:hypothetical protein [Variovorax terrae]MCJ0762155.1 hypothetical protein [Variovorax terrae]
MAQPSRPASAASPEGGGLPGPSLFMYVKIPVGADSGDELHQREETIDQALQGQGIGSVLGWGDSLGEPRPDGSRVAAFVRIDIDVTDQAAARTLLQDLLPALGAPVGTEIHYTVDHAALQDVYAASGWLLAQPIAAAQHHIRGAWR